MVLRTVLLVLIWVGWLQYKISHAKYEERRRSEAFWEREQKANFTRKKPLPVENYIHIPLETLPFCETAPPEELEIQAQLRTLAEEPIFNASGMTNTDLKLTYGTANFPLLSQYDQNFLLLQRLLCKWGTNLNKRGSVQDAKTIFEYAISIQTDMKQPYIQLADIYASELDYIAIHDLMKQAETLQTLLKQSIIEELKKKLP